MIWGGGTFDAALIEKRGNSFEPLTLPVGTDRLGGAQFDYLIFNDLRQRSAIVKDMLSNEVNDQTQETRLAKQRNHLWLWDECRMLKEKLTNATQAKLHFQQAPMAPYFLSRQSFNQLIAPLLDETIVLCQQMIKDAGIERDKVAGVLLVGGSCRIPYVQEAVTQAFKRPILLVDDPALAVCFGAAVYGTMLKQERKIPFYDPKKSLWDA